MLADDRGEEGRGIRIREVVPGGPGAGGGLQVGDLVSTINGRPIRTMDDMILTLAPAPAGQRVEFQINRSGTMQKISVVLGSRPAKGDRRFPEFGKLPEELPTPADRRAAGEATLGAQNNGPLLGVRTLAATPELRRRYKVTVDADGVLVTAVTLGLPADKIGLSPGMLITAINGQTVNSPDALNALVRQAGSGREIELTYWDKNAYQRHARDLGRRRRRGAGPRAATSSDQLHPGASHTGGTADRVDHRGARTPHPTTRITAGETRNSTAETVTAPNVVPAPEPAAVSFRFAATAHRLKSADR